ncbi:MAG: AI-2E family transporter [Devosia sp.]
MSDSQFDRLLSVSARMALVVVGSLALVVALGLGKVILAPISLAVIVGLMFGPLADFLERRGRVPPALSAVVVVVVFVGVLGVATAMFAAPLSEWISRGPAIWAKLQGQLAGLKAPLETLMAVQDQLKSTFGNDATMTVDVAGGGPVQDIALMAPNVLADLLLFLGGLYFFLATRHSIRVAVLSLCFSRRTRWRAAHVFRDVEHKISRFLFWATVINLGVGILTALATWALGMPSPLLWGALAMVMNFIPYIGQAVMYVLLLAVGLGTEPTFIAALLPVLAYGIVNFLADQFVFPHFVGRVLTLNPFMIFASVAFWLWLWGPMGAFIAVPSLLILQSLILHTFPTTRAIPERTIRKAEEKAAAAEVALEAAREAKVEAAEVKAEAVEAKAEADTTPAPAKPAKPAKRAPRRVAVASR